MNRSVTFEFRLYVAGDALNSAQAVVNLTALCLQYLPDRHAIDIVDVFREPKRALADGILMTPTLVRLVPGPIRRIVGTLGQTPLVLHALGLDAIDASIPQASLRTARHAGRPVARPVAFAR